MSFSRLQNDSATFRWDFNMRYLFFVVWISLCLFSLPCKHYNKRKGCYSPLTPCSTAWAQVRLPLFMSTRSEKIKVIPAWIHKLPRVQQMRKLQDLENSISYRQATFGKFQILPARSGNFKILLARLGEFTILPARFGKFKLLPARCGKIPNLAGKIQKLPDLAGKMWKNSKFCRQDLENSRSCRQDLENSRSCNSHE